MWKISNGDRWFAYDPGHVHDGSRPWSADPATEQEVLDNAGRPVTLAPMSDLYVPAGDADPAGLFLLAMSIIPGGSTITGTPPAIPAAHEQPADRVI